MAVARRPSLLAVFVLLLHILVVAESRRLVDQGPGRPTYAGYIPLSSKEGSSLYYAYWEASTPSPTSDQQPIVLWLQGGPGCASTFGAFYELGPFLVTDGSKKLKPNPWSFNRHNGLLVIDQPIGTGYSIAGREADISIDMLEMAEDLYEGMWGFFDLHQELQQRPFFITGESYAGKYIPSITHYILQAEYAAAHAAASQHQQQGSFAAQRQSRPAAATHVASGRRIQQQGTRVQGPLKHARALRDDIPRPNFQMMGVAIGNGLTDPVAQTRVLPSVIYNMGMVTEPIRKQIQDQAEIIIQLIEQQQWPQASDRRSKLIDFISNVTGVATLLDVRRTAEYDAGEAVQVLLNSSEYKTLMSADPHVEYVSCSPVVEKVMSADMMKSVSHLVEDILNELPVLLYQGQFDGQDGVASNSAWISNLDWQHSRDFSRLEGDLWYVGVVPAGWIRQVDRLTQATIRNAGHMVPTDQPQAMQQLLDTWIAGILQPPQQHGGLQATA